MQKIFIVKESIESFDKPGNFSQVNDFIKDGGKIISVTAFGIVSSSTGNTAFKGNRIAGRMLVVAENDSELKL